MYTETIRQYEARVQYEYILNEQEPDVEIMGMSYPAGTALRMLDNVAFEELMFDYFDSIEVEIT